MRRLCSNKWFRRAVFSVTFFGVFLFSTCWYFGIRSHQDLVAYVGMSRECHPIWQDLALKRVHAGQPIEEFTEKRSAAQIERHGAYTTLSFQQTGLSFTCIILIAKFNRLVTAEASSCTWEHTFFDELSENERLDWNRSYLSSINDQIKRRELDRK